MRRRRPATDGEQAGVWARPTNGDSSIRQWDSKHIGIAVG